MGKAQMHGFWEKRGSHFSYPTLLYFLISPALSFYTISSVNISVINYNTIMTLKNIN